MRVRVRVAVDFAQSVVETYGVDRTCRGDAEAGDEGRVCLPAEILVLSCVRKYAAIGSADDERRV